MIETALSDDEPPLGRATPSGGSDPREAGERGGDICDDEPPLGAKTPSGGSDPREAGERGGDDI